MGASGPSDRVSLPGYAVFAAMLSAAGLPIYIHAPAYYAFVLRCRADGTCPACSSRCA